MDLLTRYREGRHTLRVYSDKNTPLHYATSLSANEYDNESEALEKVYVVRVYAHLFTPGIIHFLQSALNNNTQVDTFEIASLSIENFSIYLGLLDIVFDTNIRRTTNDVCLTIPIFDSQNLLWQRVAACDTIRTLRMTMHATQGFRFGRTEKYYRLESLKTLDIDGRGGRMQDDFILDVIHIPFLSDLTFSNLELTEKMRFFILRHARTLKSLHLKANIGNEWDLQQVIVSCRSLRELTLNYGFYLPPTFSHNFLLTLKIGNIYRELSDRDINEVTTRISSVLHPFLEPHSILFPNLQSIELLDFNRSALRNSNITLSTVRTWLNILDRCGQLDLSLRDETLFPLSRYHLQYPYRKVNKI